MKTAPLAALVLCLACGSSDPSEPARAAVETAPEETAPEETAPEETAPDETAPDETAPDPAAPLPTPVQPVHGATAWGVYLAAAPDGRDPAVTGALERLRARGIEGGGSGDLGCDDGAAQALGLPPSHIAASVAFGSREDADRFVAAWPEPVLGVAEFTAYCRD
ncbi:MAG: hypothetical protein RLP09_07105 [Sandaracinaceae bacterium]